MKYFIFLLIICMLMPICAANTTSEDELETLLIENVTNLTGVTSHIMPLPEEFYGDVKYSDGTPVLAGSIITAKDQRNNTVGNFTMTENGTYGDSYKSASRLIVNAEYHTDIITFYVNDVKSTKTIKFDSTGIKRADITISSLMKPTPIPTPVPTPIPTTAPTQEPIIVTSLPTIITPTIEPTVVPTPTSTPLPIIPINDTIPKFAGVLFIALAICILGSVITYFILTRKMKREDDEEIIL